MSNEGPSASSAESEEHPESRPTSILADAQHLTHEVGKLFTGIVDLIALDGRLAALSFIWMTVLGVCLAVAIISVWVLIMIAFECSVVTRS